MLQFVEIESGLVNFKKVVEKAEEIVQVKPEEETVMIEFDNGDVIYLNENYNTIVQTLKELHELSKIFRGFTLKANIFLGYLCQKTIEDN